MCRQVALLCFALVANGQENQPVFRAGCRLQPFRFQPAFSNRLNRQGKVHAGATILLIDRLNTP
jgi:hypothetical protein